MDDTRNKTYNWYNLETNFRIYLAAVKKISPVSTKNYLSDLRYFIGWSHSELKKTDNQTHDVPEELMTGPNLVLYREYLISDKLPARTINRRLSSIRAFCGFLVSQGIIKTNPAKDIRNFSTPKAQEKSFDLNPFVETLKDTGKTEAEMATAIADTEEFLQIVGQDSL